MGLVSMAGVVALLIVVAVVVGGAYLLYRTMNR